MIDVHHHILPPYYVDTVGASHVAIQGSSGRVPTWSIEGALEGMDQAGIRTAITSISAPGFAPLPGDKAIHLARWCNEFAAAMAHDYPSRFGWFCALPLPDMDAALAELDKSLSLGADGVCLLSNYAGQYLGNPALDPLYAELHRRQAVVFVHPTSAQSMHLVGGLSASTLEFPFDTTRTIADLVFARVPTRYPGIRWIFSHAGGAMPFLSGRVEVLTTNNPKLREAIPNGFQAEIRKFYFDTALSANPGTMNALTAEATSSRILFGSDYPFGPKGQMQSTALALSQLDWSDTDKELVSSGNAAELFPKFSSPCSL